MSSCTPQPGIQIGDGGTVSIHFNKIALKYDFTKKFRKSYIEGDCREFMVNHNIQADTLCFSGEIDNLQDIFFMVDGIEDSRKPSITLTMNCIDTTITKKFNREDVTPWDLNRIPHREDVYTGTIEVKSCKTFSYGIQVVWKKSASGPNWPFNEFIQDGTISGTAPGLVKAGTNNSNGDVAVRNDAIIRNTGALDDLVLKEKEITFVKEDDPVISPSLCKDIYIGGKVLGNVKWDQPTIYKAL